MTTLEPPPIDDRTLPRAARRGHRAYRRCTTRSGATSPTAIPGMTLLQLWAFMSENLLYQASLIPDRVRLKFFELLGIDIAPATAATRHGGVRVPEGPAGDDHDPRRSRGARRTGAVPDDHRADRGCRSRCGRTSSAASRPSEGFDEQYALLFGSFLEEGGTFDYYEAEPVAWSTTSAAPLDLSDDGRRLGLAGRAGPPPDRGRRRAASCSAGRCSPSASSPT